MNKFKFSFYLIALFFVVFSGTSFAYQFDDDLDQMEKLDGSGNAGSQEMKRLEVSNDDLKAVSKARKIGEEETLIKAASKVLGRDENNLFTLNTMAVFYFNKGKLGLSKIFLKRAMVKHNNAKALHNNMGIVHLADKNQRLAIQSFKQALRLDPDYRIASANLGSIYLEYQDYERAMELLANGYRAVRKDLKTGNAEAVEVSNNYAVALAQSGKFSKAEDIYEDILDRNARNPTVLYNYAILLIEKRNKTKEGLKVLSRIKFISDNKVLLKKVDELEQKALAAVNK